MKHLILLGTLLASPLIAEDSKPLAAAPASTGRSLEVYTHPGIVLQRDNGWAGSDHLLNITSHINIVTEILKPEGEKLPFSEASIQARVEEAFKKQDIGQGQGSASDNVESETPGIPFFNILIAVYPIEKGYAAIIDGRLMESVDPLRVKLEKGTFFQAVTWEKKTLVVAPKDEFKDIVDSKVDEIVNTFIERYQFFDKLKNKMEVKTDIERMK